VNKFIGAVNRLARVELAKQKRLLRNIVVLDRALAQVKLPFVGSLRAQSKSSRTSPNALRIIVPSKSSRLGLSIRANATAPAFPYGTSRPHAASCNS
jgi:hypothetical protein